MARRGSSRTIGITKQCAVYARGECRCVWCRVRLRAPRTEREDKTLTATIDHYDHDPKNHRPDNLLPACRMCNRMREAPELFAARLSGRGESVAAGERRARAQLEAPLSYSAGRHLAERWHPGRYAAQNEARARYERRMRGEEPRGEAVFP